jgi:hypothetical protein
MTAAQIGRGPGTLGQPAREQATGAGLGDRQAGSLFDQHRRDLVVDAAAVLGEQRVGVAFAHDRHEGLIDRGVGRLKARDDLDLAAAQAGRDLDPLQIDPALAGRRSVSAICDSGRP